MRGFKVDIPNSIIFFGDKGLRNGRWRAGFSFVSLPKQIGDHGGAHLILQKKDPKHAEQVAEVRAEIFKRNREFGGGENWCTQCRARLNESVSDGCNKWVRVGEWHHIRSKPAERCDCPENGAVFCGTCHKSAHVAPKFGQKVDH